MAGARLGRVEAARVPAFSSVRRLARAVGAALLATECACCRHPMGWGRFGVCEACWEEAAPFADAGGAAAEPAFGGMVAWGPYAGRLRGLVHALKYRGRFRLGRPLGRMIWEAPGGRRLLDRGHDGVLVPVPLGRTRLAERGYNQSLLLARGLRSAVGVRGRTAPGVVEALVRCREAPPQAGLDRKERLRNPSGTFAVDPRKVGEVAGRDVLLVDDVFTTGATARECARVLRAAGAREVIVAVVARTIRGAGENEAGRESAATGSSAQGGEGDRIRNEV